MEEVLRLINCGYTFKRGAQSVGKADFLTYGQHRSYLALKPCQTIWVALPIESKLPCLIYKKACT
jgi:hypothetical protein